MVDGESGDMDTMKQKLLVCGSTGFIGRNVAEHFAGQDEYEVYGTYFNSSPLEHPNIRMIRADLTDKGDVSGALKGMDIVVQAAATTSGAQDIVNKPYYHVTDNAIMNALIFRAAFDLDVSQLVFFSCTTMYPSGETPLKETDFDANAQVYPGYFGGAWTKVYNEKMCEFFAGCGGTRFTVIRHSNIYGPYDKYDLACSHVFGATVTKVMQAQDGDKIVVWGDGTQGRDLLYVSDLTRFVQAVIRQQDSPFEIFNVGCGHMIQIKDLVAKIIQHAGKTLHIEHDLARPTVNTSLCLDCSKAKSRMDWQATISLDEGIKRTLNWYRAHHPGVVMSQGGAS
jgi:GDP-L-fucose synthase